MNDETQEQRLHRQGMTIFRWVIACQIVAVGIALFLIYTLGA